MISIASSLLELRDNDYRNFQCKLMPTVDPETVIGIRMPILRRFASALSSAEAELFMSALPHRYYEENNLHGILISRIKDPVRALNALEAFLPYVDNWATCDLIRPSCFRSRPSELLDAIQRWLSSPHLYQVRFAIEMLMINYLKDGFEPQHFCWVSEACTDEYYIRMAVAWYFAEALAVRYDDALAFLLEHRLSPWVHNKTIQKAVESYRISETHKTYLKSLRVSSRK